MPTGVLHIITTTTTTLVKLTRRHYTIYQQRNANTSPAATVVLLLITLALSSLLRWDDTLRRREYDEWSPMPARHTHGRTRGCLSWSSELVARLTPKL